MNAIRLLKQDHRRMESWLRELEIAGAGDFCQKEWVAEQLFKDLDVHTELEQQIFYPAVLEGDESAAEPVCISMEDHRALKQLVDEIKLMSADDAQYDARLTALRVNLQDHIETEEVEIFPRGQRAFDDADLEALSRQMMALQQALTGEAMFDSETFSNENTTQLAMNG